MYRLAFTLVLVLSCQPVVATSPVLPSWQDGEVRERLIAFVAAVTDEDGEQYVPPSRRIATFDNDGTLWAEQPIYFQALYAFDKVREMAPRHPQWKTEEPFASILKGDIKGALAGGEASLLTLVMATHAGISTEQFRNSVEQWLASARHPTTGRPYTAMVYQPMLELLDYLHAHQFKVFIASGGGIEFMRVWVEDVYGIPPERVIGSSIRTEYRVEEGSPGLYRVPEINFIDDKAGKPVGINQHVGTRPILAVGNSDGDFQMLEWTTAGSGPRLGVLLHHTDAGREWAYDRDSHVGRLDRGLDEAVTRGWLLIDMKRDWKTVFPPEA